MFVEALIIKYGLVSVMKRKGKSEDNNFVDINHENEELDIKNRR